MDDYLQQFGINVNFPFVLTAAGLIWARILSVMAVIPFLFGRTTPRSIRVGASVVLTVFLYPLIVTSKMPIAALGTFDLFLLFLKEILFGLSLGFAVSLMFYGFQAAGQMIDNQRGVSLARILIPELGEQVSISANFLFHFSVVLFLVLGGHRLFFRALAESYLVLPLLEFPPSVTGLLPMIDLLGRMTAKVLFLGVQLSAPVIIAVLLTDIILGVANRFAPQINVWELGFNIRGYLGILILFLSLGAIASQVKHYTFEGQKEIETVLETLKPPLAEPPAESETEEPPLPELEEPHPLVPSP